MDEKSVSRTFTVAQLGGRDAGILTLTNILEPSLLTPKLYCLSKILTGKSLPYQNYGGGVVKRTVSL